MDSVPRVWIEQTWERLAPGALDYLTLPEDRLNDLVIGYLDACLLFWLMKKEIQQ